MLEMFHNEKGEEKNAFALLCLVTTCPEFSASFVPSVVRDGPSSERDVPWLRVVPHT